MPRYCVNHEAQSNGDHEVHEMSCSYLPHPSNQRDLGTHANCSSAVLTARRYYLRANGCYWCSRGCHTG